MFMVLNELNLFQAEKTFLAFLIIIIILFVILIFLIKAYPFIQDSILIDLNEGRLKKHLRDLNYNLNLGKTYTLENIAKTLNIQKTKVIPELKNRYNPNKENYFILFQYPIIKRISRDSVQIMCYKCLKRIKNEIYFQCIGCKNFFCIKDESDNLCPECNSSLLKFPIQCPICQIDFLNTEYLIRKNVCPVCHSQFNN